jgi:hypothetical protein
MAKHEKWIQSATSESKKGSLHRQLGIPQGSPIPKKILHDIVGTEIGKQSHGVTVTNLVKARSNFALNAQSRKK